ncbi:MAG TPA: aldo/keto reductase [Candidatus Scybalocola faecigallinarum]|uniref:Aldo/keto reductase n=1 Tax=Candidatus Scybalocola faecigallinarum TaxID=2840941 RepID=A0A9D1F400_9FIRM|nr:aldo/keto reductase [Candidatus Scybalocola faecigallinarum]
MGQITLYNGVEMPVLGYGTLQITDPVWCQQCVEDAIEAGYRLIDTAAAYGNEAAVGRAVRQCGLPRRELFVTTKLWVQDAGYDQTLRAFDQSIKNLGLDYIDLYLIHQPFGDYYGAWRAMEHLYAQGAARAIGVSNFAPDRLVDLCMNQDVRPMVDQIEIHPFYQQAEAIKVMEMYGVVPQAWGPLSEAQKNIFHNKVLEKIAKSHEKTTAQVILRWHFQRGIPSIPKTVHKERMVQNLDIFDFSLSDREMAAVAALDIGHSEIIDHHSFCTARQLNCVKIHS